MMRFLRSWDWNYSKDDVLDTLEKGRWCKGARGNERETPLGGIKEWDQAQKTYERDINQLSNQWMHLFADTYKVSKRP